jgi:hypothetical protein
MCEDATDDCSDEKKNVIENVWEFRMVYPEIKHNS